MDVQGQVQEPRRQKSARPARGHLMRLGLDLQVDALLFTVSAASLACEGTADADTGGGAVTLPWHRWLREDLEALLTLAEVVVREEVDLPAGLTGATRRKSRVLEDLRARYQTVLALLTEAADETAVRPPAGGPAPHGAGAPALHGLGEHYRIRLQELDAAAARRRAGAAAAAVMGGSARRSG